jgi:general secretion pathway protein G
MRVPTNLLSPEKQEELKERTNKIKKHRAEKLKEDAEAPTSTGVFAKKPATLFFCMFILAVIAAMFAVKTDKNYHSTHKAPKEVKTKKEVSVLYVGLKNFKKEIGRYPTEEEGLKALVLNPGSIYWTHEFVSIVRPDPWMQNYIYSLDENTNVVLFSKGKDKIIDTEDDIYPSLEIVEQLIAESPDKKKYEEPKAVEPQ